MDLVAFYIEIYIVRAMTKAAVAPYSLSVTDASARGISALVNDAEHGADIVVERRRQAIAVILSTRRLERLEEAERDLRDIGLVLARAATDTGERTDLSKAISHLGFDRSALEAELDEDLAAGRE